MKTEPDESKKPALHVARRRSLIWRRVPVLAFTAGALLWLGWQFWALSVEAERIRTHDLRLVVLAGEIIHPASGSSCIHG